MLEKNNILVHDSFNNSFLNLKVLIVNTRKKLFLEKNIVKFTCSNECSNDELYVKQHFV